MSDTTRASIVPAIIYRDPRAALDWLEAAFGFVRTMVITSPDGSVEHAEMRHGDGQLMIGGEWADFTASPLALDARNTQMIHVHLADGLDAHCEHARRAGATILQEPTDQFFGDRTYRARDLEGHVWTFGQTVAPFSVEESERATGLRIEVLE
jgi:uncharacterized glyoxalase superfamily protein PhnB